MAPPHGRLIIAAQAGLDLRAAQLRCRRLYPLQLRRFTADLADALDELEEHPLRWAIWRAPDYRRKLLPPYPYAIIYHIDDRQVLVDALLDTRQNPDPRFPSRP